MSLTFDTHQLVKDLQSKGFTQEQAEGVNDALKGALTVAEVATKHDLREMELRLTMKIGTLIVAALGFMAGGVKYKTLVGDVLHPAVGAPAVTVDAVHGRLAQTKPLAAIVQVVLVFVAGDTVSVVFGGWLWLLGAGRTDQGEGQDQHDGEHHPARHHHQQRCHDIATLLGEGHGIDPCQFPKDLQSIRLRLALNLVLQG